MPPTFSRPGVRGAASMLGARAAKIGSRRRTTALVAADHQAVAPLRPPDSAAGPDVHVVDALRFQFGGAADVIVVVGVAAVDDHVVAFEKRDKGVQRRIDHGGRHHHPDGAGLVQLLREVFERRRPDRSLFDECLHGFRMEVVNDALVAGPQKAPHHVGSHPAQSDHAQFHGGSLSSAQKWRISPICAKCLVPAKKMTRRNPHREVFSTSVYSSTSQSSRGSTSLLARVRTHGNSAMPAIQLAIHSHRAAAPVIYLFSISLQPILRRNTEHDLGRNSQRGARP